MILGFDPTGNPLFTLLTHFDAKAILRADLQDEVEPLNFLIHLVVVNNGGALDFESIDEAVGAATCAVV